MILTDHMPHEMGEQFHRISEGGGGAHPVDIYWLHIKQYVVCTNSWSIIKVGLF